jgi:hypothetical protein
MRRQIGLVLCELGLQRVVLPLIERPPVHVEVSRFLSQLRSAPQQSSVFVRFTFWHGVPKSYSR